MKATTEQMKAMTNQLEVMAKQIDDTNATVADMHQQATTNHEHMAILEQKVSTITMCIEVTDQVKTQGVYLAALDATDVAAKLAV